MKEITYEDWQKNPTPRVMWVWNEDEMYKVKRKVVHILRNNLARVITIDDDNSDYEPYKHCAEIEKQRRMTNKELSRWLREKPTREYKYRNNSTNDGFGYDVYSYLSYLAENAADKEVNASILIREDKGKWREPLVEVEE